MDYMDDTMIGDPVDQSSHWIYQSEPDNCAVAAELSIMHQFGVDITQDQANYISAANGWYHPGAGGTAPNDIGKMMDLYNIPNHSCENATVADLARELQQGHGVIVGVDSDQLWDQGPLAEMKIALLKGLGFDTPELMPADHAVVVTGIDTSDPNHPMVILNDSGHPGGAGVAYPLDRVMDAWENGHFYYTATDNPIPANSMKDIEHIDFTRWISVGAGIVAGGVVLAETGDIQTSIAIGGVTTALVEDFFADPHNIAMV